jgi:hypothetical protein
MRRATKRWRRVTGGMIAVLGLAACSAGRRVPTHPALLPAPDVVVGACADPARDGVLGATPRLARYDRDLDGDGRAEVVTADLGLCTAEGNCHWNLFSRPGRDPCARYLGTIAGAAMDRLAERGERGFSDVRSWWRFGGGRVLLQEYRFRHGGYRLVEALLCRPAQDGADARLQCAPESQ